MGETQPSSNDRDSLPSFRWKRTLLLLAASWAIGYLAISYSSPEMPTIGKAIVGFVVGVIVVGMSARIF